jgi:AAA15 family ATPase/GTPase
MSELLLDSLEIKGYRCFEHLTIEKLGRVNLIVGKNNVGKTALLEALWIYSNNCENYILDEIVFNRNEVNNSDRMSHNARREYQDAYRNFFYNRPIVSYKDKPVNKTSFIIGNCGQDLNALSSHFQTKLGDKNFESAWNEAGAVVRAGKLLYVDYSFESGYGMPSTKIETLEKSFNNLFLKSKGMEVENFLPFWEKAEKELLDEFVNESLNIVEDKIVDIRFSGDFNNPQIRIPTVRLKNAKERVPLRSLGEGMERMLGIALALVNCKDGMLLIDEVEIGFHYSVLPDVWKLIFKTAKDLNVQVFATTHSKDCIEAFTQSAVDDEESDGMLIRLERKDDKIKAFTFDEDELETISRRDIEVR